MWLAIWPIKRTQITALIAVLSRHRCREQIETRVLNLRQSPALPANANSFSSVLLLGHIGSHVDLTSGWWRHQAKLARTRLESYGVGVALRGDGREDCRLAGADGVGAAPEIRGRGAEGRRGVEWNPLERQGLLVWAPGCRRCRGSQRRQALL